MLNFHPTSKVIRKAQATEDLTEFLLDSTYVLKIKDSIATAIQDNANREKDLLFGIMKFNSYCMSMQYVGEK